jgi:hypothetical protein
MRHWRQRLHVLLPHLVLHQRWEASPPQLLRRATLCRTRLRARRCAHDVASVGRRVLQLMLRWHGLLHRLLSSLG